MGVEAWCPEDKLRAVAEHEKLDASARRAYLKQTGLRSADIERWREQALAGIGSRARRGKHIRTELPQGVIALLDYGGTPPRVESGHGTLFLNPATMTSVAFIDTRMVGTHKRGVSKGLVLTIRFRGFRKRLPGCLRRLRRALGRRSA